MTIKFFKIKGTEIRKAAEMAENGEPVRVLAVIGRAGELLEHNVIFPDNVAGNEDKWLVILSDSSIIAECLDLQPAKDVLLHHFGC